MSRLQTRLRPDGFTLVELLVSLAIIGMLAALLLPAVNTTREAARRTICRNNQRTVGLALHMFHDAHQVFPASGWTMPGPANPSGAYTSWRVTLAPYIELSAVSTRYDHGKDWWTTKNLALGVETPSVFRCASTPSLPPIYAAAAKSPRPAMEFSPPLARCDYEALMGVRQILNPTLYANKESTRGVIYRNSRVKFSAIRDGASQSIVITESAGRPSVWRNRQPTNLLNDQGYGWLDSESGFSLDGASADGARQGLGPRLTPISMNATNENEPYSFHPGGVNFVFADGRVQFLSEQTELAVLAALATRAGGEIIQ